MTLPSTPSHVCPATDTDAPAVRALQSLLSEPAPRLLAVGLTAGNVLVSTAPSPGSARASPGDGVPVGYLLSVGGDADADGGGADGDADGADAVHVAELAVSPEYRREGRASELLRALCGAVSPDSRVTVTVEPSNRAARACYESLGFEATARREEYFDSGPAVVYERRAGAGNAAED